MASAWVELRRSGWIDWDHYAVDGTELWALPLIPLALLVNVFAHRVIFRGGWTLHVHAEGEPALHRKIRYRRKAPALADLPRYEAIATDHAANNPLPPPTKLPTRGGNQRRPW